MHKICFLTVCLFYSLARVAHAEDYRPTKLDLEAAYCSASFDEQVSYWKQAQIPDEAKALVLGPIMENAQHVDDYLTSRGIYSGTNEGKTLFEDSIPAMERGKSDFYQNRQHTNVPLRACQVGCGKPTAPLSNKQRSCLADCSSLMTDSERRAFNCMTISGRLPF